MYIDLAVVTDETFFAKLVHKEAYARPRCTYHFRQSRLAKRYRDTLRTLLFTKICKKQQQSRQSSLARIKQLINQIVFDPGIPCQEIGQKERRKLWLGVQGRNHQGFGQRREKAFLHRMGCGRAQFRTIKATFSKKLPLR